MRLIILIALASIAGYGILQIDRLDPDNYVKMYLGNWVVELKVVQFLLLLLLLVLVLYFIIWLFRTLWRSPKSVSRWWHRRSRDIAEEQFGAGYLSLIKGDWRRAESQLTKKTDHSHISYVNFLAAARAAAEQGKLVKRDEYLLAAYRAAPQERLAIGLTKAKLHERAEQIDEAQATLEDLKEIGSANPQFTAMLLQIYERKERWDNIDELLPTARKQKALPELMLNALNDHVYTHRLVGERDKITAFKSLPRAQRKRLKNIAVYARALLKNGDSNTAEKLIRGALKKDWSDELVEIYGQIPSDKPAKLLRQVEGWLLARPESAQLNLAAGRLAKAAKSFDAAAEYLQTAIAQAQLPAAYSVLGEVYEANNESGKALQMYRVGMQSLAKASDRTGRKALGNQNGGTSETEDQEATLLDDAKAEPVSTANPPIASS
jgi:HemY protein